MSSDPEVSPSAVVGYLDEVLQGSEEAELQPVDLETLRKKFGPPYLLDSIRRFPDFLGIGAQKAGTTWLHRSFESHPEVWVPKEKELHYFDEKYERLDTLRRPPLGKDNEAERWRRQLRRQLRGYRDREPDPDDLAWDVTYFLENPSDEWYGRLFPARHDQVAGELTPEYSALPVEVLRHVHGMMPDIKIIFFMRNPVERAWSHAAMGIRLTNDGGEIPDTEVEDVLLSARSRQFTNYTEIIDRWTSVFPESQFFLGFLEDISMFPGELLSRLYRFLGVSDDEDRYRVLKRKVHSGEIEGIGASHAYLLAKTYMPLMEELDARFGGYASGWLHVARAVLEQGPDGLDLPYPLWHWEPWRHWAGTNGQDPDSQVSLQSGTLIGLSSSDA